MCDVNAGQRPSLNLSQRDWFSCRQPFHRACRTKPVPLVKKSLQKSAHNHLLRVRNGLLVGFLARLCSVGKHRRIVGALKPALKLLCERQLHNAVVLERILNLDVDACLRPPIWGQEPPQDRPSARRNTHLGAGRDCDALSRNRATVHVRHYNCTARCGIPLARRATCCAALLRVPVTKVAGFYRRFARCGCALESRRPRASPTWAKNPGFES